MALVTPPAIPSAIPLSNAELIREAIVFILSEELPNQSTLNSDPDLNARVFKEKFVPVQSTQQPLVNVLFSSADPEQDFAHRKDLDYTYFIDCYTRAKSTDGEKGDTTSSLKLHRLLFLCAAIFQNPVYRTLGLAPGFIGNVHVSAINVKEPENNQDAHNSMMGRVSLRVKSCEKPILLPATLLTSAHTSVILDETTNGYFYEI